MPMLFEIAVRNAHSAAAAAGRKRITLYGRTLKSDGQLNEKYPGGISGLGHFQKRCSRRRQSAQIKGKGMKWRELTFAATGIFKPL